MEDEAPFLFENLQVNLSQLPRVAAVDWQPLERRYLQVELIRMWIFRGLVLLVLGGVLFFNPDVPRWVAWSATGFWLLMAFLSHLLHVLGFRIKGYAVREHDIIYRTGLLFRRSTVIPFTRIQHSEIQQGFIERQFELSRLAVFTAGGSESDLVIPGLNPQTAEQIRRFLSKKVEHEA